MLKFINIYGAFIYSTCTSTRVSASKLSWAPIPISSKAYTGARHSDWTCSPEFSGNKLLVCTASTACSPPKARLLRLTLLYCTLLVYCTVQLHNSFNLKFSWSHTMFHLTLQRSLSASFSGYSLECPWGVPFISLQFNRSLFQPNYSYADFWLTFIGALCVTEGPRSRTAKWHMRSSCGFWSLRWTRRTRAGVPSAVVIPAHTRDSCTSVR